MRRFSRLPVSTSRMGMHGARHAIFPIDLPGKVAP